MIVNTGIVLRLGRVVVALAVLAGVAAPVAAQEAANQPAAPAAEPVAPKPAADATAPKPAQVPVTDTAAAAAPATPPALKTECVVVNDLGFFDSLIARDSAEKAAIRTGAVQSKCAVLGEQPGVLNGSGDLSIAVSQKDFEAFRKAKEKEPGNFVLFLNGVPLTTDARLIARETVGELVVLRYRINQGKESQLLWSMLYADGKLIAGETLHAALGWKADTEATPSLIPARTASGAQVQITTGLQLALALALVALTIGVVIYIGKRGDSLRDTPLPAWWATAESLKAAMTGMDDTARNQHLAGKYSWYTAVNVSQYEYHALQLLKGRQLAEADIPAATVGLALLPQAWTPLRATYSLSRTQLALWFTFTVSAGLFLWMLYGDLRRIDGSLLLLLGISVTTAAVSWIADRNITGQSYTPSQGFLNDLLTGFDERKQLHRYQAVVVNLLLLSVGIFHVGQQLSYPVFDASWLIFLGISGSAYGVGKRLIETKTA